MSDRLRRGKIEAWFYQQTGYDDGPGRYGDPDDGEGYGDEDNGNGLGGGLGSGFHPTNGDGVGSSRWCEDDFASPLEVLAGILRGLDEDHQRVRR